MKSISIIEILIFSLTVTGNIIYTCQGGECRFWGTVRGLPYSRYLLRVLVFPKLVLRMLEFFRLISWVMKFFRLYISGKVFLTTIDEHELLNVFCTQLFTFCFFLPQNYSESDPDYHVAFCRMDLAKIWPVGFHRGF